MKVFIEKENRTKSVSFKGTAKGLLKFLNVSPQTVILIRDDTLITLDTKVTESDEIRLLSVISGG